MARYYFDLNHGVPIRDNFGVLLQDDEHARREALKRAHDYVDASEYDRDGGAVVVTVRSDRETVVMTVRLVVQVDMA